MLKQGRALPQALPAMAQAPVAQTIPTPVASDVATPYQAPAEPQVSAEMKANYGVTLSNLNKLKEKAREKIQASNQGKEKITITTENLQAAWLDAIELVASQKMLYKSAIAESILSFEAHEITIHANLVALDFLKPERLRLLDFFKRAFHDEDINVLFAEKENSLENTSPQVLTTREIFEKMAVKNPYLKQLKDAMGLDFEY